MRTHCFRLTRGADLKGALDAYAKAHDIRAAVVLAAVGCLSQARIRDASGVTVRALDVPLEIVSLTGTVSRERIHLHLSAAREDLSVVGGHLLDGCIVNTTVEIVLLELTDTRFFGAYDEQTGYTELMIERKGI